MKTISITATSRPHYLRQVLQSLKENNLTGYELFISLEGTPQSEELCETACAVDWIPCTVMDKSTVSGVRKHPYELLTEVFKRGSSFNLYLEDDVIVSPDAIDLCEWFQKHTHPSVLCLSLLNYQSSLQFPSGIKASKWLSSLGIGMTRDSWAQWFEPNWMSDEPVKKVYKGGNIRSFIGWDWTMRAVLELTPALVTYTPTLSRSNHIGREGGVHCTPQIHDRLFATMPMNMDPHPKPYHIV